MSTTLPNVAMRRNLGGVPDGFPVDIQRLIFEMAAREDRKCALQLVLVARHVRTWIEPILYECIVVRTEAEADYLLRTITSRPVGFFEARAKSIAFDSSITFGQAKRILAECSLKTVNFAVWGPKRNPTVFLPFIRSPTIKRLTLQSQRTSEINIPPTILSSLTHLLILDGPYTWYDLRKAIHHLKLNDNKNPDYVSATKMFPSLTHFGVCSRNWGSAQPILKLAKNLKYFAVIIPVDCKSASMITQRIAELGDRRVVLVEHSPNIENWETSVRGGFSIWEKVEKLVHQGRISEQAEVTWSETEQPTDHRADDPLAQSHYLLSSGPRRLSRSGGYPNHRAMASLASWTGDLQA